jgi:two-component system, response regulator
MKNEVESAMSILLADDDENDANILFEAIRDEGFKGILNVVHDGDNLLAYLAGADGSLHSLPDLILLDVRMQRVGGIEALQRIQSNPRWAHIPVVIMSGVCDEKGVRDAYRRGAKAFLLKPFCAADIQHILDLLPQRNPPPFASRSG